MDGGWSYLGGLSRRLRWTIVGAIVAGLAWQGAALTAPLLIVAMIGAVALGKRQSDVETPV
jgi:hypothetical protein